MIKEDIVEKVYKTLGFSKKEAAFIVGEFFQVLKDALKNGEDVKISGFGNFMLKYKKPRRGRNPQTGEDLIIGARKVVTFRCSPILKEALNGGKDVHEDRGG